MANLTPDELDVIEKNPLGDSLNIVREALREVEVKSPKDASESDDSTKSPERPRLFMAATGKLLSILSASDVPLSLASRTGKHSLLFDITIVRSRVQNGDVEYQPFRPLLQQIIEQAPDFDIWNAVVALVRALSLPTPPASLLASLDTPEHIHPPHSRVQNRHVVKSNSGERHCIHRAVAGFHKKYFEDRKWSKRAERIWQRAKSQYRMEDKSWAHLPGAADEDDVCDWMLGLQGAWLANERAAYYRSTASSHAGAAASRQLDLLVKMRRDVASNAKHEWRNVLVVGELKKSDQKTKSLWLQVGSAVRNVFASQPTRLFVHAFTITGTEMETWVFDRSGPYSGAIFDFNKQPKKFFQVMCGYLMMTDQELGLDTVTKQTGNKLSISLLVEPRGKKRKRGFQLDPTPIAHPRAIVCRGTTCFLAKTGNAAGYDKVVKFSWTSSKRPPEADLLRKAKERGVRGLAQVVGYNEEITSISKLREGLVFPTRHKFRGVSRSVTSSSQSQPPPSHSFSQFPSLSIASKRRSVDRSSQSSKRLRSNSQLGEIGLGESGVVHSIEEPQGTSLVQQDEKQDEVPFENRIFRILAISPAGRSIRQFQSVLELLEGLRDAIQVHRSLYVDGRILHRDISENNIIITNPETADGFKGMLIDLDLAKEVGKGPSGDRTGTMEFMAIEVLLGISHTYRHDLEAFFYVLLWLCARRGWSLAASTTCSRQPKKSMLLGWYTGDYEEIARNKRGDMDKNGLETIMREFPDMFDAVKPMCRTIRDVLFPHMDGLFTGTPRNSTILYDPIIKAFNDAVADVQRTGAES